MGVTRLEASNLLVSIVFLLNTVFVSMKDVFYFPLLFCVLGCAS